MTKPLPSHARVVIIGGGVIGCSIAYHLTKLGWTDVVLLERKQLTCGTTWHAAGLLTTLRDTEAQTKLAKYTQDLYRRLEAETGQATGLIQCGSIQLATSTEFAPWPRSERMLGQAMSSSCSWRSVIGHSSLQTMAMTSFWYESVSLLYSR